MLIFQETDNRVTKSLRLMLRNLHNIFGEEFWSNTIIESTHYAFDELSVRRRRSKKLDEVSYSGTYKYTSVKTRERGDIGLRFLGSELWYFYRIMIGWFQSNSV